MPHLKAVIAGIPGAGKTTLAATLPPGSVLFADLEAGMLSIPDFRGVVEKPRTWKELRNLICWVAGPDPSLPASAALSHGHYDHVVKARGGAFAELHPEIRSVFVDSLTEASRMCRAYCEQLPEVQEKKGNGYALYGAIAREMIGVLNHLRHAELNVVFAAILERKADALGKETWSLQLEGSATGRALAGIVDLVAVAAVLRTPEGVPYRALVTGQPNPWDFECKDRTGGVLDHLEAPDLGAILAKLEAGQRSKPRQLTLPPGAAL